MAGNRDAVQALLQGGADVNTALGDGMTALHYAALKNDAELARMLLVAGANVKSTTRLGGYTPLLLAARTGNAAVMDPLIAAGADPNSATVNGTTALMLASRRGQGRCGQAAARQGRERQREGEARATRRALMFAAANGRADVMRLLTAKGADLKRDHEGHRHGDLRERRSRKKFAQFRQQQAAAGREERPAAPRRSAAAADAAKARPASIASTAFPELIGYQGGLAAIHIAARQGSLDSVQALLDAGGDINQRSAGDHITPIISRR